jgi:hypothetical protein
MVPREDILRLSMVDFLIVLAAPVGQYISPRESSFSSLAYRGTWVIGTDTLCLSLSCREYRVMAKRASRVPRIIQMLIRITADARVLISSASENPRYRR